MLLQKIRDLVYRVRLSVRRSAHWSAVRNRVVTEAGCCAGCGSTVKLEVHHIKPFHVAPELELEPSNLIVLCETPGMDCHLRLGHGGDWRRVNTNVRDSAALLRANPHLKTKIWVVAKTCSVKTSGPR